MLNDSLLALIIKIEKDEKIHLPPPYLVSSRRPITEMSPPQDECTS